MRFGIYEDYTLHKMRVMEYYVLRFSRRPHIISGGMHTCFAIPVPASIAGGSSLSPSCCSAAAAATLAAEITAAALPLVVVAEKLVK